MDDLCVDVHLDDVRADLRITTVHRPVHPNVCALMHSNVYIVTDVSLSLLSTETICFLFKPQ